MAKLRRIFNWRRAGIACVSFVCLCIFFCLLLEEPEILSEDGEPIVAVEEPQVEVVMSDPLDSKDHDAEEHAAEMEAKAQRPPQPPPTREADSAAEETPPSAVPCEPDAVPAQGPNAVHVVYAASIEIVVAVKASLTSLVLASTAPANLTIHILVLDKKLNEFTAQMGFVAGCTKGRLQVTQTLVEFHPVDERMIAKSLAVVPTSVQKERGALQSVENYARFYMDKILLAETRYVVYLDADTIVQADLVFLVKELERKGKTLGLVSRSDHYPVEYMLGNPKSERCQKKLKKISRIMKDRVYNVGVLVVDLQRWSEMKYTQRIEFWVDVHNRCAGSLWKGGSQPPLLLAFLETSETQAEDFVLFHKNWDVTDLGWKVYIEWDRQYNARILHWTGPIKPWHSGKRLHTQRWDPYMQRYEVVLTSKHIPELLPIPYYYLPPLVAAEGCVGLDVASGCVAGRNFKCSGLTEDGQEDDDASVTVSEGCRGGFMVGGKLTFCGSRPSLQQDTPPAAETVKKASAKPRTCGAGELLDPVNKCGIMLLSSYLTTIRDWQRGVISQISFDKIQYFYVSALRLGLNVTLVHDQIPIDFVKHYTNERFHFVEVDSAAEDPRLGVNDVRYIHFRRLVGAHPEWNYIFIMDAFDVRVARNPCPDLKPDKIYVGSETTQMTKNVWLKKRFLHMGGKYEKWFNRFGTKKNPRANAQTLNCGITGGHRAIMLDFLDKFVQVIEDRKLAIRAKNRQDQINVNMAVLNYLVHGEMHDALVTGEPLHSRYWTHELERTDVWFIHK